MEGQAGLDECQEAMSEALRGIMVKALLDQLNAEVTTLCGPYYKAGARSGASAGGQCGGTVPAEWAGGAVCPAAGQAKAWAGSVSQDVCGGAMVSGA